MSFMLHYKVLFLKQQISYRVIINAFLGVILQELAREPRHMKESALYLYILASIDCSNLPINNVSSFSFSLFLLLFFFYF